MLNLAQHALVWITHPQIILQLSGHLWHQVMEGATGGGFTNRVHFPLAVMPIQLGYDQRGMGALARQVEFGHFLIVLCVDQAAIGVLYFFKALPAKAIHGKHQAFDVGRNTAEIDGYGFVIAIACASAVVTQVTTALAQAMAMTKP